jgi:acetyl-CoA carboxylase biotin carboxyl carrier protein
VADTREVLSPFPGIFYRRPEPDAKPFVEPGDRVEADQTIGLVELMKTFQELRAGVSGILRSFLVENEAEVAVGQAVAVIETSS